MAGTDLYQTTNTTGDLVLRDLPDGPFQLVTKVTAPIDRQYQQAGLIIYGDDDNYIKLVAQGRSSSPAVASNIIQLTKELNATATGGQHGRPRCELPQHGVAGASTAPTAPRSPVSTAPTARPGRPCRAGST
jgi:hypothetical protein